MKSEFEPKDIQAVAERVAETLKPYLDRNVVDTTADNIMDTKGLCAYLKVTPKWVHERTHLNAIPFYKLSNKQLRFRKRDIDKWLDSMKTLALSSPSSTVRLLR